MFFCLVYVFPEECFTLLLLLNFCFSSFFFLSFFFPFQSSTLCYLPLAPHLIFLLVSSQVSKQSQIGSLWDKVGEGHCFLFLLNHINLDLAA